MEDLSLEIPSPCGPPCSQRPSFYPCCSLTVVMMSSRWMVSARQVRNQILLTTEWNGGEQLTRRTHWIPEWWGEWGSVSPGNIWGMRDYGKETLNPKPLQKPTCEKHYTFHLQSCPLLFLAWLRAHCLTQKPHHTSRIPLTPVHTAADGSAGLREGREGAWCGMGTLLSLLHPHGWMFAHFMRH